MNKDVLQGNWKQIKGEIKKWWGNVTDDDLTKIDGSHDKLVGVLQERYGYARERAESEVNRRLEQWDREYQMAHPVGKM